MALIRGLASLTSFAMGNVGKWQKKHERKVALGNTEKRERKKKSKHDPRTAVVPVRFTDKERTALYEHASPYGMSLSEYVRRAALKRPMPVARVGDVNLKTYQELCRIGNNVNQLVRSINESVYQLDQSERQLIRRVDVKLEAQSQSNASTNILVFLSELKMAIKEIGLQVLGHGLTTPTQNNLPESTSTEVIKLPAKAPLNVSAIDPPSVSKVQSTDLLGYKKTLRPPNLIKPKPLFTDAKDSP